MTSEEVGRRRDSVLQRNLSSALASDLGVLWLRHFGLSEPGARSVCGRLAATMEMPATDATTSDASRIARGLRDVEIPRLHDSSYTAARRHWSSVILSWGVLVRELPSEYDLKDVRLLNAATVQYIGLVTPFREQAILTEDDGLGGVAAQVASDLHLLVANHALDDYTVRIRRHFGEHRLRAFEGWAGAAIESGVVALPRQEDWSAHLAPPNRSTSGE